jgi:hypothetical protein
MCRTEWKPLFGSWESESCLLVRTADGQRIVAADRTGKLTAERAAKLLHGTVARAELPPRPEIPLDAFRREFDPLT